MYLFIEPSETTFHKFWEADNLYYIKFNTIRLFTRTSNFQFYSQWMETSKLCMNSGISFTKTCENVPNSRTLCPLFFVLLICRWQSWVWWSFEFDTYLFLWNCRWYSMLSLIESLSQKFDTYLCFVELSLVLHVEFDGVLSFEFDTYLCFMELSLVLHVEFDRVLESKLWYIPLFCGTVAGTPCWVWWSPWVKSWVWYVPLFLWNCRWYSMLSLIESLSFLRTSSRGWLQTVSAPLSVMYALHAVIIWFVIWNHIFVLNERHISKPPSFCCRIVQGDTEMCGLKIVISRYLQLTPLSSALHSFFSVSKFTYILVIWKISGGC